MTDGNLHVDPLQFVVSTLVTFWCSEGFEFIGSPNSMCLPNCTWTNPVPQCLAIRCSMPLISTHTLFIQPAVSRGYAYSDQITYGCRNRRSRVFGDQIRTCQENGEFSGKEPVCYARCSINTLNRVRNGKVMKSSKYFFLHGGWIEIYCYSRYRLIGASYIECNDGEWSNDPGQVHCVEDSSADLVFPVHVHDYAAINGVVQVIEGSNITVDCMFLSRFRRPHWVLDPYGAKKIISGALQPTALEPNVYQMELIDVSEGDAGTYFCLTPYGSNRGKIEIDVIATCGDPGIPKYGFRFGDDFTIGHIVVFSCSQTATLRPHGRSTIRCSVIGNVVQWSHPTPICYKETCQNTQRDAPMNGIASIYIPNSNEDFAIQTFTCNYGYKINGQATVTCNDYTWDEDAPTCVETCRDLNVPVNGTSSVNWPNPADDHLIQTFDCDIGYELNPSTHSSFTCTNGQWTPMDITPTCVEKTNKFVITTNAMIEGRLIVAVEGDNIQMDCNLQGSSNIPVWVKLVDEQLQLVTDNSYRNHMQFPLIQMSDAGTYYCSVSQHKELIYISVKQVNEMCSVELYLSNGDISGNRLSGKYFTGHKRTIKCRAGFTLHGDSSCTCQENGWDCEIPTCIHDLSFELRMLSVLNLNSTSVCVYEGSDVVIDCSVGELIRPLFETGMVRWYRTMANQQIVRDGFTEFLLDNGNHLRLVLLDIRRGSEGVYTCASPLQSISVHIQIFILCPLIESPTNGVIINGNRQVGTVVTCECDDNYVVDGSTTRICQSNGEWTGHECSCTIFRCPTIQAPENGWIVTDGNDTIGKTLEFYCNAGFRLDGEFTLQCNASGRWSASIPTCQDICENNTCSENQKCVVVDNKRECICRTGNDCPPNAQPVCGSDSNTYDNVCILQMVACETQTEIHVAHTGRCLYEMCSECQPAFTLEVACRIRFKPIIVQFTGMTALRTGTKFEVYFPTTKDTFNDTLNDALENAIDGSTNGITANNTNEAIISGTIDSSIHYDTEQCQCPRLFVFDVPYLIIPTLYIHNEAIIDTGTYVAKFDNKIRNDIQNLRQVDNTTCATYFNDIIP